jgi:hypothetical protein
MADRRRVVSVLLGPWELSKCANRPLTDVAQRRRQPWCAGVGSARRACSLAYARGRRFRCQRGVGRFCRSLARGVATLRCTVPGGGDVIRASFEVRCSYQSITRKAANASIPQKAKVVTTMTRLRMITCGRLTQPTGCREVLALRMASGHEHEQRGHLVASDKRSNGGSCSLAVRVDPRSRKSVRRMGRMPSFNGASLVRGRQFRTY